MKAKLITTIFYFTFLVSMQAANLVFAEQYPAPNRQINFIVTASPGGNNDMQIRAMGPHLSKYLRGARIMVENNPGASGKLAYAKAYKAKPDGYTLLSCSMPGPIVTELLEPDVQYKTADFVPIFSISKAPFVLVVHSETWKTIDEFVQEGLKRTMSLGTTGNNNPAFLQAVAFANAVKIKANFVPFGSGAEATATLAGKHIDAVVTSVLSALSLVKAGKLRALMVLNDEPEGAYPGVPLSKGSKWEVATFPLIATYVAPPKFSTDKVKILEAAFAKAIKEPAFINWANSVNLEIKPMNAAQVRAITNDAFKNATRYKSYFNQ